MCSTPVYLFVPPIPVEHARGTYSMQCPLDNPLYYWSCDPDGQGEIPEEDWDTYGIPGLEVLSWTGISWGTGAYDAVDEFLKIKDYSFDGKEYARDYGYPELVLVENTAGFLMSNRTLCDGTWVVQSFATRELNGDPGKPHPEFEDNQLDNDWTTVVPSPHKARVDIKKPAVKGSHCVVCTLFY
ncbi:hypothetical protein PM082_009597 [Marasmius tenuissimus]|nr:hypothetical protein PM082_009597 [Marasmius tenuissimus]